MCFSAIRVESAAFVEVCQCPPGHTGQHCEWCAPGYRREPANGGVFARCVPCTCNNHSDTCDPDTGKCDCVHHTSGENCEKCAHGYYGSSITATPSSVAAASSLSVSSSIVGVDFANMCKKCPCPENGACAEIYNHQLQNVDVVCLECPLGTQGNLCEQCDDGYFMAAASAAVNRSTHQSQVLDTVSTCQRCTCNGNIDENALGNCDSSLGHERCLKCVYNTSGEHCERCLPNYWGNPLGADKCRACDCNAHGTRRRKSYNSTTNLVYFHFSLLL